jgi:hypothetical protein
MEEELRAARAAIIEAKAIRDAAVEIGVDAHFYRYFDAAFLKWLGAKGREGGGG